MSETRISFQEIPRTSRLFSDYLYNFDRVARFYQNQERSDGRTFDALVARAPQVTAQGFARNEVAAVLVEQNQKAGAGAETFANIERLRQADSVVVITGQQAGLFTGPLYTIFKALTAIKLAEDLRARGVNAVPMFWIAAEDHDFQEVNHTRIVNREGQVATVTYTGCSPKEGKPVGHVTLRDEIAANLDDFINALPESEFVAELADDLRAAYAPGEGFGDAFGAMMMRLLGKYGVVLINPLDDRLKQVAGALYTRAMENVEQFAANLVDASAALESAGYHAQVYTSHDAVPLFMMDEGRRTALVRRADGRFQLKGSERSLAADELMATVRRCPMCFSPNVTFRPLVQDYLLPTLAYIGGPAEIAYFAQLRPNYALLGRVDPVVLPRASFTLIEKRNAKTMSKHGLKFTDLFAGQESVTKKIVEQSLDQNTANAFDETERVLNEQLDKLSAALVAVEPTLADALKGGRDKVLYQITNLRARFISNRAKRDETTQQQFDRLFSALYPNKNLQEREINAAYFLARYGYGLIDQLYADVEPGQPDHKLIYL